MTIALLAALWHWRVLHRAHHYRVCACGGGIGGAHRRPGPARDRRSSRSFAALRLDCERWNAARRGSRRGTSRRRQSSDPAGNENPGRWSCSFRKLERRRSCDHGRVFAARQASRQSDLRRHAQPDRRPRSRCRESWAGIQRLGGSSRRSRRRNKRARPFSGWRIGSPAIWCTLPWAAHC